MSQPTPTKTFRERISEITPSDLIYPGIIFIFAIIITIIFFLSTKFLGKNINDAFLGDTGSDMAPLNMANYTLVAKKLGITTATTQTTTAATSNKSNLTINIINATSKKGVAATLATALESAGFTTPTTSNQSKLSPTTTIAIKTSKASFGPAILEEVKKLYTTATATTTEETAQFDVTITIGG